MFNIILLRRLLLCKIKNLKKRYEDFYNKESKSSEENIKYAKEILNDLAKEFYNIMKKDVNMNLLKYHSYKKDHVKRIRIILTLSLDQIEKNETEFKKFAELYSIYQKTPKENINFSDEIKKYMSKIDNNFHSFELYQKIKLSNPIHEFVFYFNI